MYDFAKGDYKAILEKMPTDPASFRKAVNDSVTVNQKLSELAISAAEKSAEVSTKWGREILGQLNEVNAANENPTDYVRKIADLGTASVGSSADYMTKFAEIARQIQIDTLEVLLSAGNPVKANKAGVSKSS
ncbi:MAG: hypothetical protein OXC91_03065 [Rhodobacteraceae bacterium]|nr:hypothetical protein [Paracoccaceae bacterium]